MPLSISFTFDDQGEIETESHQPLTFEQWSLLTKFVVSQYFKQSNENQSNKAAERIKEYGI